MKFRWQLLKFRYQLFGIQVSNFPAFYEHRKVQSRGVTPHNGIYGSAQKGVPFSDIRSMKG